MRSRRTSFGRTLTHRTGAAWTSKQNMQAQRRKLTLSQTAERLGICGLRSTPSRTISAHGFCLAAQARLRPNSVVGQRPQMGARVLPMRLRPRTGATAAPATGRNAGALRRLARKEHCGSATPPVVTAPPMGILPMRMRVSKIFQVGWNQVLPGSSRRTMRRPPTAWLRLNAMVTSTHAHATTCLEPQWGKASAGLHHAQQRPAAEDVRACQCLTVQLIQTAPAGSSNQRMIPLQAQNLI